MPAECFRLVFGFGYVQAASGRLVREGVRGIRYGVGELDLSKLGERAVMVVLTYPGEWWKFCPDDRELNRQIGALLAVWGKKWGDPVGFWVKEFQDRGAPHVNLYVGWPDGAGGYEEARERTLWLERRKRVVGGRQARDEVEPVSGEFGWWLRTAWARVVTGNNMTAVAKAHHARGCDVRVSFWTDKAEEMHDRAQVAWYIAREVGKKYQKTPPVVWGRVRPWWAPLGLEREAFEQQMAEDVWHAMSGRLAKYCAEHDQALPWKNRGGGVTAWGMSADEGLRLLAEVEGPSGGELSWVERYQRYGYDD
jgi:hypothetical protein